MSQHIKQQIADLEQQISILQGRNPQQQLEGLLSERGGVGALGAMAAGGGYGGSPNMQPEQIQQIFGLLAGGANNPEGVGMQYVRAMQNDARFGPDATKPSNVREWEYYNSLPESKKKNYLEMKRGVKIADLAGGKSAIYSSSLGGPESVTTLPEEASAATTLAAAGKSGQNLAGRYDILNSGKQERYENYSTAQRLRQLVESDKLKTGLYTQLVYKVMPTADQESLDALAEFVARARLKASGEIRPTDADVVGAKRALFGAGRTEEFTVESLDRLLRELEQQEAEYSELDKFFGLPSGNTPAVQQSGGLYSGGVPPPTGGPLAPPTKDDIKTMLKLY